MTSIIPISLGERSYNVVLGQNLLQNAYEYISPILKRKRIAIIADENAWKFHGKKLSDNLAKNNVEFKIIEVASGEKTKSFASFERVCEELLEFGIERSDIIIAFGGGVVGDLTGFAASVINRGVDFIQIPTTLLSQVDSSVGGKTAINAKAGKNLIGVFWQPRLVLADTGTLDSLNKRDIMAGFAEIFKMGLIKYSEFFDFCETNTDKIINSNGEERLYAIKKAIEGKAEIVELDERENGVRALLNLGHTFGHAIEGGVNYDENLWRHGEAVALGIAMAARFSNRIGLLSQSSASRIVTFLKNTGYRTDLSTETIFNANDMLKVMSHDKKNSGGQVTLVLLNEIGEGIVHKKASNEEILEFLKGETSLQNENRIHN